MSQNFPCGSGCLSMSTGCPTDLPTRYSGMMVRTVVSIFTVWPKPTPLPQCPAATVIIIDLFPRERFLVCCQFFICVRCAVNCHHKSCTINGEGEWEGRAEERENYLLQPCRGIVDITFSPSCSTLAVNLMSQAVLAEFS